MPALALAVAATACVYDASSPCSADQKQDERGFCVCVDGMVLDATMGRCVACGAHERADGGKCVCEAGWTRPSAGAACAPSTLGDVCDTASKPCASATYPTCQPSPPGGTAGYCTNTGCATSADCTGGYACNKTRNPAYCQRPPVGQGQSCASDADCAGTEATFCLPVQNQCVVQGCNPSDPNACFEGWLCCDLGHVGLPKVLCLPTDKCP